MSPEVARRLKIAYNHLKYKGLIHTQEDLAAEMGLSRPTVSAALNGSKERLTRAFLMKFCDIYDTISLGWLLTGEGEMLQSPGLPPSVRTVVISPDDDDSDLNDANSLKYYYDMDVTASNIEDLADSEIHAPFRRLLVPGFEGCAGFNVTGESMLPTARPRDIAAIEPRPVELIINGEIYMVVTRDGQRMIKRLQLLPNNEGVRCYSDNDTKAWYAPFDIEPDQFLRAYRVRGFISITMCK